MDHMCCRFDNVIKVQGLRELNILVAQEMQVRRPDIGGSNSGGRDHVRLPVTPFRMGGA